MSKVVLIADLRSRFGDDAVSQDTGPFAISGASPAGVVAPSSVAQVSEVMAYAHERNLAVIAVGNATHLHVGSPPLRYDVALSLRRLDRIVAHEAADMTVTVEAGCTLAPLDQTLARAQQWLPLDPPSPARVTVGGLIAANLNGPLRLSQGKVRDLLIGITVVLADGSVAKGGGRVVKNVAGYDVGKLFTGSFGTLGVIVEATFKIRPRPERTRVVWIGAPDVKAAGELALGLLDANIAPLSVEVLNATAAASAGRAGAGIVVGLGGIAAELDAQESELRTRSGIALANCDGNDGTRLCAWLCDFPRATDALLTARVSLLPTELVGLLPRMESEAVARNLAVSAVVHAGNGVARLGLHGDSETRALLFCEWLRIAVRERGGWVVFDSLPDTLHGRLDPFGNPTPAVLLMRAIKQQLDPRGILSPGRFVGGI
ncbi:MAG TPA: FAD-binding oxidoreductase [Candidatus Kryptonia bacterium]|nr:FAD-binding oxidoreductase [Candidatus Kryptonia bacterium]